MQLAINGPACYTGAMTINEKCICADGCETARCYLAFNCWDCTVNTYDIGEYYMVTDELWELATIYADNECPSDVMLCIGCLENRIGGKLVASDFPDYPINRGFFEYSTRLRERLLTLS